MLALLKAIPSGNFGFGPFIILFNFLLFIIALQHHSARGVEGQAPPAHLLTNCCTVNKVSIQKHKINYISKRYKMENLEHLEQGHKK